MTTNDDSKLVAEAIPVKTTPDPIPVVPAPTFPRPQPGQGDPGTPGSGNIGTGGVGVPSAVAQAILQAVQNTVEAITAGANDGQDSGWLQAAVDNLLAQGDAEFDNPFSTSKPPPNLALRCTQAYRASSTTLLAELKQLDAQIAKATPAQKVGLEAQRAQAAKNLGQATENYAQCLKGALQMKS